MGTPPPDHRFRVSAARFLRALVKRLWFLIPGGLLGAVDVYERLAGVEVAPPTWVFVAVLMLGFLLSTLLTYHDLRAVDLREVDTVTRERDEARRQLAANSAATEAELDDRHVVSITPERLTGLLEGHTDILARRLVEPYLDKWLRVSGPLNDVSEFSFGSSFVYLEPKAFGGDVRVILVFRDQEVVEQRLSALSKGDRLTALGQIKEVYRYSVKLDNCELKRVEE